MVMCVKSVINYGSMSKTTGVSLALWACVKTLRGIYRVNGHVCQFLECVVGGQNEVVYGLLLCDYSLIFAR